jgi:hypothetical protein
MAILKQPKLNQFALIAALIVAVSPAAAQTSSQNNLSGGQSLNAAGQSQSLNATGQQLSGQGGRSPASPPVTGVICMEEMTATFCNVVSGPNTAGYGSGGGSSASGSSASSGASTSSAGGGTNAAAIPACGQFPPANELCN